MDEFRAAIESALADPAMDDMRLREIVRQQLEERGVEGSAAYTELLSLHAQAEDDHTDDLLVAVMDYLTGYCNPALALGSSAGASGQRARYA